MSTHPDQRASSPNDIHTEIANLIESGDPSYSELGSEPPHPADVEFPEGCSDGGEPPWAWLYGEDLPTIDRCAAEPQNDTGNGKRLLTTFGNELLHVRDVGWHGWARTHWRVEGGSEIATRCAQITAARIALEANVTVATPLEQKLIDTAADAQKELVAFDKISDPTSGQTAKRKRLESAIEAGARAAKELKSRQSNRRNFSITSGNAPRIRGMLDQAMPHRTVRTDLLNLNKLAFNVSNGTLHFICDEVPDPDASDHSERTIRRYRVELRSHNRDDNITMVAPVIFEKHARCPKFCASIERFQPTASVRHFLQQYHGYGLTGLTGEQCLSGGVANSVI
jgi:putative DNA primase/helicase